MIEGATVCSACQGVFVPKNAPRKICYWCAGELRPITGDEYEEALAADVAYSVESVAGGRMANWYRRLEGKLTL